MHRRGGNVELEEVPRSHTDLDDGGLIALVSRDLDEHLPSIFCPEHLSRDTLTEVCRFKPISPESMMRLAMAT